MQGKLDIQFIKQIENEQNAQRIQALHFIED